MVGLGDGVLALLAVLGAPERLPARGPRLMRSVRGSYLTRVPESRRASALSRSVNRFGSIFSRSVRELLSYPNTPV